MQARPSVMWLLVLHKTELSYSNKMDAKYAICVVKAATEVALCKQIRRWWLWLEKQYTMDSHRMYIKCKTFAGCYSAHRMGRKHTRLIGDNPLATILADAFCQAHTQQLLNDCTDWVC